MNILLLDIETAPNRAYVWGLFDQNISANQVEESSYVLCWSAKWLGAKKCNFMSVKTRSRKQVLKGIWGLLNEADAVVHFNGTKFDIPTLNKEFVKHHLAPPKPYKQIDLYRASKTAFRFESHKLDYLCEALGFGRKLKHEGFDLWVKCMAGNAEAWKVMEQYNRRDVDLLEQLYIRLRPWIKQHPNVGLANTGIVCPTCASAQVRKEGTVVANLLRYQQYSCKSCFRWFRGNKALEKARERGVNI